MEEKNRFSKLLEQLMTEADIKNYTLAQELQYDVSYISKWISGRMIPAERTEKRVLRGISHCIVSAASPEGLANIIDDYSVEEPHLLELAIFDHLEAEYNYVKEQEKNTESGVGEKTAYYPELSMTQYLGKMHHPVLRRVKSLDVISVIDLMALPHESKLQFVNIEGENLEEQRPYPDVHFSLVINLERTEWDDVYDTLFLIHLLTNSLHIDFQLYSNARAYGRAIFVVKNDFMIAGMLDENNRCISVVVSEDAVNCNTLYDNLKGGLSRETLLFRKTTIQEMIAKHDYAQALLSPHLRWLMGHMTEHFLPDRLFEQLVEQVLSQEKECSSCREAFYTLHKLNKSVLECAEIQLMVYASAFSDLVVSNELDFYSYKVKLTPEQKVTYLNYFLELCEKQNNLNVKMVYGRFVPDFQFITNQCVFLSDKVSYLRLDNGGKQNHLMVAGRADIQAILDCFFQTIWEKRADVVVSDQGAIREYILHMIQGIQLIAQMNES